MLCLGLICREGAWDRRAYGNGLTGEVLEQKIEGARVSLELSVRAIPGMYSLSGGRGRYRLRFTHDEGRVEGAFEGAWDDIEVGGVVIGHRHRPVPTPDL